LNRFAAFIPNRKILMTTTLFATFDGEVLRPELPIRLAPNTRVRLIVETDDVESAEPYSFLDTAEGLNLEGPGDWSEREENPASDQPQETSRFRAAHRAATARMTADEIMALTRK
jgi:hypothetical protein